MRIKIVNEEHGIGACNSEDVPGWITVHGRAEDVAFFYCHERDFIVLNEDNVNYRLYCEIITAYMEFNDKQKKEFKEGVSDISIRAYMTVVRLNYMLRIRRNLHKSMMRKAGAL